jgi:4-amino-4-deoxy-L-arabinose transferase-like glycosyltransferase
MLTYIPQSERPAAPLKEQDKPWLLLLLCLFWLLPGLVGHDPWKPQENEAAALIVGLLRSNHWVLPYLADQPYFDTAPLYFWVAALFANALTWFGVAVHDAARLSTGVWMALALWGTGLAGRELFGHRSGRLCVIVLLGGLGLLTWGHHVAPAALALSAYAWLIYALALSLRKPLMAGVLLGISFLALLLGATWADALLALCIALCLLLFSAWRKPAYAVTLVSALIISLPLAALWGYALHTESSALFQMWWRQFVWGPYGGASALISLGKPGFLLSTLPWFAWPMLPLAIWSLWINRHELTTESRWPILLVFALAHLIYITLAGAPSEVIALPLLVVFSLMAVPGVDDLRRGAASALNSFSILTFGLLALVVWGAWFVLLTGYPTELFVRLSRYSSAPMQINAAGLLFALIATGLWGSVLLRRRALGRKALTNWVCGLILVFGLIVGLFQNWIDTGKSYRPVADKVQAVTAKFQPTCLDGQMLPSAPLGALAYFGATPLITAPQNRCPVAVRSADFVPPATWVKLGDAKRLGEINERFVIYLK